MAVNVRTLPPQVARAAQRARDALGTLSSAPLAAQPVDPELAAFAEWAISSGELSAALRRVAESDPDLAD